MLEDHVISRLTHEPKLLLITACPSLLSFYMGQHFTSNMETLLIIIIHTQNLGCLWYIFTRKLES